MCFYAEFFNILTFRVLFLSIWLDSKSSVWDSLCSIQLCFDSSAIRLRSEDLKHLIPMPVYPVSRVSIYGCKPSNVRNYIYRFCLAYHLDLHVTKLNCFARLVKTGREGDLLQNLGLT